ncbi:DUF4333 domain-containing protein [Blastococcus montanus]|uniref:DUF4333 domain-containing protein n=1 Tax=Blastococcus montanus TaxID=3144973 RepID=UPI003207AA5B
MTHPPHRDGRHGGEPGDHRVPWDQQQPWGGPPPSWAPGPGAPPPHPGRRAALIAVLSVVALAVAAAAAVLAVSTGPTVLSRGAVERDVAAQFEEREGVAVVLRCTEEMLVEEGATYECTGVTADDEEVTLRLEITDTEGAHYTWTEP